VDPRPNITGGLAEATRQIHSAPDVESALHTVVEAAQRSLPGITHVGVSITHRDGTIETMAATDPVVGSLDQLQYEMGEGPCFDAIRHGPLIQVDGLAAHADRWPHYAPKALALGVRAQLGLRLFLEEETLGGLNLYAMEQDHIDPDVRQLAELFATHAALALGRIRQEENLHSALHARKVIGQAIGIVMAQYELDQDRAFQYLARVSQNSNVKLRDVAEELVLLTNERNSRPLECP
jgi:GAF domain-containing protein